MPSAPVVLRLRRAGSVAVLVVVLLGAGTAVFAATRGASFTMDVVDGRTTLARGQLGGFRVDVQHHRGHRRPITLRATGLPRGSRHFWVLPDGRALPKARLTPTRTSAEAVTLDASHPTAFLVVSASRATRIGVQRPVITAKSGRVVRRQELKLVVARRGRPSSDPQLPGLSFGSPSRDLSMTVAPARRHVVQTDVTTFDVALERSPGVGPLELSIDGLPAGGSATVAPANPVSGSTAQVTVAAARGTPVGEHDLTIAARSLDDRERATAATTLVVDELRDLGVTGDLPTPLGLGETEALPLRLTNPYDFPLRLERLDVSVATAAPGCPAEEHFAIRQPDLREPVVLPPGASLLADHLPAPRLAAVTWTNTDVPQNACVGVPLRCGYAAVDTR